MQNKKTQTKVIAIRSRESTTRLKNNTLAYIRISSRLLECQVVRKGQVVFTLHNASTIIDQVIDCMLQKTNLGIKHVC